jgi:prefoldin subunit 5
MSTDSNRWPLLNERAPLATTAQGRRGRKLPRSVWLLTGLAFICGGLVSAAAFSIGWRHQAQRDTAAQTALAAASARTHRLDQKVAVLQSSRSAARAAAAAAATSEQSLARAAERVGGEATATGSSAASISSGAGSLSASSTRIVSELKTLDTYLTTTPVGQLDPGYIASQTAYLTQQLTRLQGNAGTLGSSVASLQAALRRLGRDAATLKTR